MLLNQCKSPASIMFEALIFFMFNNACWDNALILMTQVKALSKQRSEHLAKCTEDWGSHGGLHPGGMSDVCGGSTRAEAKLLSAPGPHNSPGNQVVALPATFATAWGEAKQLSAPGPQNSPTGNQLEVAQQHSQPLCDCSG